MNKVIKITILSVVLQASVWASQEESKLSATVTAVSTAGIKRQNSKGEWVEDLKSLDGMKPSAEMEKNDNTVSKFFDLGADSSVKLVQQQEDEQVRAQIQKILTASALETSQSKVEQQQGGWSIFGVLGAPFRAVGSLFASPVKKQSDIATKVTHDTTSGAVQNIVSAGVQEKEEAK